MRLLVPEKVILGSEPMHGNVVLTEAQLSEAYNWYNYFHGSDDTKKWLILYLEKNKYSKETIEAVKSTADYKISKTIGFQARIMNNGSKLSESSMTFFCNKIDEIVELYNKKKEDKKEEPLINQQNKIKEYVSNIIGELETVVDKFTNNNYTIDFSTYNWLEKNQIKAVHCSKIIEYYSDLLKELDDAKNKRDAQLVEGYAYLKKNEMNQYIQFLTNMIDDLNRWSGNQTKLVVRKPRKKKVRTVEETIKNFSYKYQDKELKMVSVNPGSIIGANTLWVYNTKYKSLGVYHSNHKEGLNIKGTTIINFDPNTSVCKTLRKPQEVLTSLLEAGKVKLRTILTEVNCKEYKLTGRINDDILLVRVIK
jgi:hypothetical protein